jgi:cellulose synthase/poly-beta-1,6-N-acetylglucosamine synthase-like glycosyltransferase
MSRTPCELSAGAEHEILLISDSNVRVGPDYLRETAAELSDPDVALVSNVLVGQEADRLGRLNGKLPPPGHVPLIPVKDLLMAGIWLAGAFRKTVNWRGNLFYIERGSRLVPQQSGTFTSTREEVG